MVDLSIIIVTWNSEKEIVICINSILKSVKNISYEIITVDNNSTDSTLIIIDKYKSDNFKIIKLNENLGFTKGCNTGIKASNGRKILLLNPDIELTENAIEKLNIFLETNPKYGGVCPLLKYPNGNVQYSIRNFPDYRTFFYEFTLLSLIFSKSKEFGKWKMKYFNFNEDQDVNQPMAAALMIKKSVLDEVGCFDDRFEMFFNDVDLCKIIINKGYKIRYLKDSIMMHKKGASIYKNKSKMVNVWNKDCIKYFKKYHNNYILVNWLKINLYISGLIRKFI